MSGEIQCNLIHTGDALQILRTLPENCIDAIVCDPPAGINFMGKEFDRDRGGRTQWVAWLAGIMAEAQRVLKPGGHAFVWALPKTSHWTACALEDAGFEIREKFYHLFGSGYPKSHNLSKAIDAHLGAEREVIGLAQNNILKYRSSDKGAGGQCNDGRDAAAWNAYTTKETMAITSPATPEAEQWEGWGTATKPAVEEWILCRKPLAEQTVAANVLKWGTGGLNIAVCRVGNDPRENQGMSSLGVMHDDNWQPKEITRSVNGRWPSHLLLSHSPECVLLGTKRIPANGPACTTNSESTKNAYGEYAQRSQVTHRDPDGSEEVEDWQCVPGCPVLELDRQSGYSRSSSGAIISSKRSGGIMNKGNGHHVSLSGHGDRGGASRYFQQFLYCPKASRSERNLGCESLPEKSVAHMGHEHLEPDDVTQRFVTQPQANIHPTVKPIALMSWLCRLITPPGGLILDPFTGSGSTGVAAIAEGFRFIGIELDAEYAQIARARLEHALAVTEIEAKLEKQLPLFEVEPPVSAKTSQWTTSSLWPSECEVSA